MRGGRGNEWESERKREMKEGERKRERENEQHMSMGKVRDEGAEEEEEATIRASVQAPRFHHNLPDVVGPTVVSAPESSRTSPEVSPVTSVHYSPVPLRLGRACHPSPEMECLDRLGVANAHQRAPMPALPWYKSGQIGGWPKDQST